MSRIARLIAAGGGAGYAPAPGTAGSLVALPVGLCLLQCGPLWLGVGMILATIAGLWAIPRADGQDDPGWVVIDEVVGMWISLLGLSRVSWTGAIAAFALFRLFDIAKPGPIGWADRMHGRWGVMLDDVLAGAFGAACLVLVRLVWHAAPL